MTDSLTGLGIVFVGLAYLIAAIILTYVFAKILLIYGIPTKSKAYRKYLTNLYVAGRIRQLAEEDKIDLIKEDLNCLKYVAVSEKSRIKELDDKIESELINKVDK